MHCCAMFVFSFHSSAEEWHFCNELIEFRLCFWEEGLGVNSQNQRLLIVLCLYMQSLTELFLAYLCDMKNIYQYCNKCIHY